jgi:DnaK suppressor protein
MLSTIQIEAFKTELLALRAQLGKTIELSEDSSQTVELDQTLLGRVSRGDALQQQEMAKAGLELSRKRIVKIAQALKRIDEDDYGFCLECAEEIICGRLGIMPEAEYCIACQEQAE